MVLDNGKKKPPTSFCAGRFELVKKLGAGCFGDVYLVQNKESGHQSAVKIEDDQASAPQLQHEADILALLRQPEPQQGFATCVWYGKDSGYHWLVMDLLGGAIEAAVTRCSGKFKPKTTVLVAQQVLHRIEYIHSKGIVHRDIKPENFMFGKADKAHHIYLIDFGLSKRYWDEKHIQTRSSLSLTGTARYASINAHKGQEQSRRDDLEAIGHMFMYFLRGALPWSGLEARTKQEKYKKIMNRKESTSLDELCAGYPRVFQDYLQKTRELGFTERPDYQEYQDMDVGDMLQQARTEMNIESDHDFEWQISDTAGLVPLIPRTNIDQPDDKPVDVKPASSGKRFWQCCICASKPSDVRD
eukprot:TRINITY_DN18263_c0_g1_i2.p1 TRINITY_DN18263_c0_g1~~TRINITY_DN18263_c0_g1_i2.p1  ORF type:complete len:357 (-),score=58.16 TRINITY_DN18263_c0_g1_i2:268-1338(-)